MAQIRAIARDLGIHPGHLSKTQLIRTIQRCEGNFACYATANDGNCDQPTCLWRRDCLIQAGIRRAAMPLTPLPQ